MGSQGANRTGLLVWLATLPWLALGCSTAAPETYGPAAAVDSIMEEALESGPLAGASVSIAQAGRVVFSGAYGSANLDIGVPVTHETRFNVASVGKVIASAVVMQLVDDGLLDLTTEASALLPELAGAPALEGVQLGQLLNMTSGLSDYVEADIERWLTTRAPLEPAFVLDHVRTEESVFAPGSEWMYTNTGFYLAGLVVERTVGRPWGAHVANEVLPDLGLDETALCDEVAQRSIGYELKDTALVLSVFDQETGVRGDAGLCATTADLARLPASLLGGFLSPGALDAMMAPTRLENGADVDYGYGVARGQLFGRDFWGHLGGSGSNVAALMHFGSDDMSIAVAVNTRGASLGALILIAEVARFVLAPVPTADPELSPEVDLLARLAGTYSGDRTRTTYVISHEAGGLVRTTVGAQGSRVPLVARGTQLFGRDDWPLDVFRFHIVDGRAVGYSTYLNGIFDGYYARRD